MKIEKILIVAAHPDDELLGCGGLLAKHRSRVEVRVLFLAEGTTCRYKQEEVQSLRAQKQVNQRSRAALQALDILNVDDVFFANNTCGRLDQFPVLDLNKLIEYHLNAFAPDTIFTHSVHDVNNDHQITYKSVLMATRPGGLHHIPNLFCFETPSSTEWNFNSPFAPNYFEILSESDVHLKWKALSCYSSEIREYPHPRSEKGIKTLARYRGMQANALYAEAFQLVRRISE